MIIYTSILHFWILVILAMVQTNDITDLRLRDTRARAVRNVLGNLYLSSLTKNLWYEEGEQLDSGSGGML